MEGEFTRLLLEWRRGSPAALDALLPLAYGELRRIAARQMARERSDHTLQATALVHEAWLQLAAGARIDWQDRAHFLAVAARLMRQILIQHARAHNAEKRGSGAVRLELTEALERPASGAAGAADCDLLDLDRALEKLAAQDERKGRLVEMKFFGGLTNEEIADVAELSVSTVRRDLQVAYAFLNWQLRGEAGDPAGSTP